ncbi:jg8714 [Pararge aegeria aegeria]|uniref:Jg8714 protein n=1 Tax=Pararge aegeria aegeria TaxID=348720 RepID=A0A8S4S389_9NEOP|nr:jg8714 [Pararge aegeria aegeria]
MIAPEGHRQLVVSDIRNEKRNEEIRIKTRVTDIAQGVAKLNWKWVGHIAQRTDGRLGSEEMDGDPAPVNAALVVPQRGGQTTSNESLGATGSKRPRAVNFGTPYRSAVSSSGLQSVEVLMMMMMIT